MPNNIRQNPKCDGKHCTETTGEVRAYPITNGTLHLCLSCYQRHNLYRKSVNRTMGERQRSSWFPVPRWQELKIVTEEVV